MSLPCSTMPAVVPATALTEAGAVVCRPTETQRGMRRRRVSLKGNKLGSPFASLCCLTPADSYSTVTHKKFILNNSNSDKVGKILKNPHITVYAVPIFP